MAKLVLKTNFQSFLEWPFYIGFTVFINSLFKQECTVTKWGTGVKFGLSLHQLPYFVYASREGYGKTVLMPRLVRVLTARRDCAGWSESWPLVDAIATEFSCAGPCSGPMYFLDSCISKLNSP